MVADSKNLEVTLLTFMQSLLSSWPKAVRPEQGGSYEPYLRFCDSKIIWNVDMPEVQ
jgi:hypothetical protein